MFNEDEYRDRQLNKYLDQQDLENEEVSNCCGSNICDESDICCDCRDHCTVISKADYLFDEQCSMAEERGDAEMEARRCDD